MKESAQIALSLIRTRADILSIETPRFKETGIHLHVPAGAIPKDGPSAGITMAVALISLLTGRRVRPDLALTGELTLRGKVLPVGGIKEKILAARRAGVKTVILPKHNEVDLDDIPSSLRQDLTYCFVESIDEVLPLALEPADGLAVSPAESLDSAPQSAR
jgi:ATP-dependent Lon protease